jgi:hypothetical protein
MTGVQFPIEAREVCLLHSVQTSAGTQWAPGFHSPELNHITPLASRASEIRVMDASWRYTELFREDVGGGVEV